MGFFDSAVSTCLLEAAHPVRPISPRLKILLIVPPFRESSLSRRYVTVGVTSLIRSLFSLCLKYIHQIKSFFDFSGNTLIPIMWRPSNPGILKTRLQTLLEFFVRHTRSFFALAKKITESDI
jgi:hypothetical protein